MQQWTATQTSAGIWTFTWTPTAGRVYEIWFEGLLIATTEAGAGTYTTTVPGSTTTPPAYEIHDTTDGKAENEEYPPRTILQWRGVSGASLYEIEQLDESNVWLPVGYMSESGAGWYMYTTGVFLDGVEESFRITALDHRGVGGTAVRFNITLVCNPIPAPTTVGMENGDIVVRAA